MPSRVTPTQVEALQRKCVLAEKGRGRGYYILNAIINTGVRNILWIKKSLAGQVAKLAKIFSRKFQLYSTTHMHVHVHVPVHYIVAVITLYCALAYFRRARGCFRPLPLVNGNPTLNKGFLPWIFICPP